MRQTGGQLPKVLGSGCGARKDEDCPDVLVAEGAPEESGADELKVASELHDEVGVSTPNM